MKSDCGSACDGSLKVHSLEIPWCFNTGLAGNKQWGVSFVDPTVADMADKNEIGLAQKETA